MGCPNFVVLGLPFSFSVTTHDPDTAGVVDADVAPTYRVYSGGTLVTSGTMTKTGAQTGFYAETLTCSAPNFATETSYSIEVTAAVGGVTAAESFDIVVFDLDTILAAILAQVNLIQADEVTPVTAAVVGTTLTIVAGATYLAADSRALRIAVPTPVNMADVCSLAIGTIATRANPVPTKLLAVNGTFVTVGATTYASFDLTAVQTAALPISTSTHPNCSWDLYETLADGSITPISTLGPCIVIPLIPRA